MRSFAAAAAIASALHASVAQDQGYDLLWTSALDEFSDRCVRATRPIPGEAHGDFIIPSVGQFEMGSRHFVGQLDAFGKMQRFEIKGDEVCATYRMMSSGFYNESKKINDITRGLLFFETEPPRHCPLYNPVCNLMGPNDNTFVNTIKHNGRLLSMTDGPILTEVDPKTMHVSGAYKFEDSLQGATCYTSSAHPVVHPVTGQYVDFVANAGILADKTTVRLFHLDEEDPRQRKSIADVDMDEPPYMHSFGLTPKHVVLPRMPIKFDLKATATKSIHDAFVELDGGETGFKVVSTADGTVKTRPLPAGMRLYYTHTVNTYENETGVIIDLCTLKKNPFSGNLTVAAGKDKSARDALGRNVVKRFHLPFADDVPVTVETLSDPDHMTDFTRANPNYNGVKHCYFWGDEWFSDKKAYGSMSIVKYDVCHGTAKRGFHRENAYPSEPTFIPSSKKGAAEDEGVVVFTILDGPKDATSFVVLDAASMEVISEAGPFPRIGFTTHGEFYPADAADARGGRAGAAAATTPVVV